MPTEKKEKIKKDQRERHHAIPTEAKKERRKKSENQLKSNKMVPNKTEQLTENDILLPKHGGQSNQSYVDFKKYVWSKQDEYKGLPGIIAKAELRLTIVNHFAGNGKRFFGYNTTGKIGIVSDEWVSESIKRLMKKVRKA